MVLDALEIPIAPVRGPRPCAVAAFVPAATS